MSATALSPRLPSAALRGAALALAAFPALALAAEPLGAPAGDAPEAAASTGAQVEEVLVIGTRSQPRSVRDGAVPVDVLGKRAVEAADTTGETSQVLQALVPSINLPRISVSGSSDSVRPILLRGLSPDQVLVLVNGKRRHTNAVLATEGPFAGTAPVDVNAIPPGAIERIEVLRDGAGAQYGSDAVAGVINIVLKEAAQGGRVSARYGLRHTRVAPLGRTVDDGQGTAFGADGGLGFGQGGRLHLGVELDDARGTNRSGPATNPPWLTEPADVALAGRVLYASGDPAQTNLSCFYDGAHPLAGGELYSFATVNARDSVGDALFRWPSDAANVPSVHPQGYRPRTTLRGLDGELVAGWRRESDAWGWDLSGRVGYDRVRYGVKDSLNSSLGSASPSAFHLADFRTLQAGLDADARRAFAVDGLAGPVVIAFGAQLTRESYATFAGDEASFVAGPNTAGLPGAQAGPGLRPADAVSLGRGLGAVYADVASDVTSRLLLDLAGRFSAYEGAGIAVTGKAAARVKLTQGLLLRGSVSNSFRAPALAQTGFRQNTLNFDANGTSLVRSAFVPPDDPAARLAGARDLSPERSVNVTLGAAFRLGELLSLSVDAYQIGIRDRITRTSDIDSEAFRAALAARGLGDVQTVSFLTNAIDSTTRGVDVVATHRRRLAGGTLALTGAYNYNTTRFDRVRRTTPQLAAIDPALSLFSDRDLYTARHGSPTSKLILGADWSGEALGFFVSATRYGSLSVGTYDDTLPVVDGAYVQRYGADWSIDAEGRYTVRGVTVALGANNVLDRYPALQAPGNTYWGALPYSFYPPIGFNGRYLYARATYRF